MLLQALFHTSQKISSENSSNSANLITTDIKEEPPSQIEPDVDIKEDKGNLKGDCSSDNKVEINDNIANEAIEKTETITEEEQKRISDEKVAEAIRNHDVEFYDNNDSTPESDEDFKVCDSKLHTVDSQDIVQNLANSFGKFQYKFP